MEQMDLFANDETFIKRKAQSAKKYLRRFNGQFATREVVEKENQQRLIDRLKLEAEKFKRAWLCSASEASRLLRENKALRDRLKSINEQSEVKGGVSYA
jgi:hypothetical protein